MNKIKTVMLAMVCIFALSLTACSNSQDDEELVPPPPTDNGQQPSDNGQNPSGNETGADTDYTPEQQEVADFINRRNKAMVDRDLETLRSMMADDLVLVHMSGQTQSKEEWLEEIQNETMRYYSINIENLNITINGNKATATYTSIMDARIWGSRGTWRMNSTMNLEKTGNRGWLWTTSGRPQGN